MKRTQVSVPTVCVGIPAYNEASSIGQLLASLLKQRLKTAVIDQIVVYSDASTDATDKIVRHYTSKVQLVRSQQRVGKPSLINRMCQEATSDILVVLDADIGIAQSDFLERLTAPIRVAQVDLTSARIQHAVPQSEVAELLAFSMTFKERVFTQYKSGKNIYTCHGRARAFSKKLYSQVRFPTDALAEDAYSFLFCQQSGGAYAYVSDAVCTYRLPQTRADHDKQSARFFQGKAQLEQWFSHQQVSQAYALPFRLVFTSALVSFFRQPRLFCQYLLVVAGSKLTNRQVSPMSSQWDMSQSTKSVIGE